ncbi:outer membrane lipoprotein chaperone LolA [Escherichia coli]
MMKKLPSLCALLSSLVASSVWADAASDLKSRLDKVSSFHASFTQKVMLTVAARRCRKVRAMCR